MLLGFKMTQVSLITLFFFFHSIPKYILILNLIKRILYKQRNPTELVLTGLYKLFFNVNTGINMNVYKVSICWNPYEAN